MGSDSPARSAARRILSEHQAQFVDDFMRADAKPFQMLVAPPGTGKTTVALAIVEAMKQRSAATRVLLVTPTALARVYAQRLAECVSPPPVLVDGAVYREMAAVAPRGAAVWPPEMTAVVSEDLFCSESWERRLSEVFWDLVIVDDIDALLWGQPSLQRLVVTGQVGRMLLVARTAEIEFDYDLAEQVRVTTWEDDVAKVLHTLKLQFDEIPFRRSMEERRAWRKVGKLLSALARGESERAFQVHVRELANSSIFAVERFLLAMRDVVLPAASGVGADDAARRLSWSGADARWRYEDALVAIDKITFDEKLFSLKSAIARLQEQDAKERVVVFTAFTPTADYLETGLQELAHPVCKITELHDESMRLAALKTFRDANAVLVITDLGAEVVDLSAATTAVEFDKEDDATVQAQRIGRLYRFGRTGPLRLLYLHDLADDDFDETP